MIPTEVAALAQQLALADGRAEYNDDDIAKAFAMCERLQSEGYILLKIPAQGIQSTVTFNAAPAQTPGPLEGGVGSIRIESGPNLKGGPASIVGYGGSGGHNEGIPFLNRNGGNGGPSSSRSSAPVEASGSEREKEHFRQMVAAKLAEALRADHQDAPFPMDEHQAAAYHRTRADLLGWVLDMLPADEEPLIPLRPQPSVETREAVARVEAFLGSVRGLIRQEGHTLDPADLRVLLSARSLALGDQQGDHAELIADLRRYRSDCTPSQMEYALSDGLAIALEKAIKALSTTPARAEALDEERQCDECGFKGTSAQSCSDQEYCTACGGSSPQGGPDKCVHCGVEGHMVLACPKCGGRFSLDDEAPEAQDEGAAGEAEPRAIADAPRDGTMLRLWVRYPEDGSWTPLEDALESWTIGFNNFDNTEDDRWQVVGWSWSHDLLVEASNDVEVLGWLPFHGEQAHPSPTPAAELRKVSALPVEGDAIEQMTGLTVVDALDDPVSSVEIMRALSTSSTLCVWADGTYRVAPTLDVPIARAEEGALVAVIPMAEIGEVATPAAADADRVREIVVDAVKVAMKDAWEDHANDTGCWPADIKRVSDRGPLRLMFVPAIWAQTTAEWAAETVLAALKSTAAKDGESDEAVS